MYNKYMVQMKTAAEYAAEMRTRAAATNAALRARLGISEEQQRAHQAELLAYAAGWIEDPGCWESESDDTLTLEDEEGAEDFGPTHHDCAEPKITCKTCRWQ
jgi:hypothetical protein